MAGPISSRSYFSGVTRSPEKGEFVRLSAARHDCYAISSALCPKPCGYLGVLESHFSEGSSEDRSQRKPT